MRPTTPDDCPQSYVSLMEMCWDGNPLQRPPFQAVVEHLEKITDNFLLARSESEEEGGN